MNLFVLHLLNPYIIKLIMGVALFYFVLISHYSFTQKISRGKKIVNMELIINAHTMAFAQLLYLNVRVSQSDFHFSNVKATFNNIFFLLAFPQNFLNRRLCVAGIRATYVRWQLSPRCARLKVKQDLFFGERGQF